MRNLYLDCSMGAAGDMMTAALLELLPEEEQAGLIEKLNDIGLEGICVKRKKISKCGILGSHIEVLINGEDEASHENHNAHHHARHMSDIEGIIDALAVPEKVKSDAKAVYKLIAEAESHVHGAEVSEVHLHEVGMKDAIADVTAVCMLMDIIAPDKVTASPIHTGSGQIECAHGIMPVPAPATAHILRGVPVYSTGLAGELCTPTGAALLKYFVDEYGSMPLMTVEGIGYGMGKKDFPVANCIRAMLGNAFESETGKDVVTGLSCNVDDMTGEEIGFATEMLYEAGAKEVFTVPVGMKKSRPGILLEVLCAPELKESIIRTIFRHTTTIGIRETVYQRHILDRSEQDKVTALGRVRMKRAEGYGVIREKYEYEDLVKLAREKDTSIQEIRDKL